MTNPQTQKINFLLGKNQAFPSFASHQTRNYPRYCHAYRGAAQFFEVARGNHA